MKRTLITNIGMLATPQGTSARGGRAQGEICILKNAWIFIENDVIAQVGTGTAPAAVGVQIINAGGKLVTPGLVDAHTHLIFGGWRQNELALKLYGAGYRMEEKRPSPLLYENSIRGIGPLYEALVDLGADAAICVHVFPAMMMTELRCGYGLRMPTWFVATDFTCSPGVGELQLDGICIPHPALTPEFLAAGLPAQRIFPTGIPIRRQFCQTPDRDAARRQLELEGCRHVFTLACGSMGAGPLRSTAACIAGLLGPEDRLVAVCGSNQRMHRQMIDDFVDNPRVRVLGFTEQMCAYMQASDLLISKAGGLTTAEAVASRTPLLYLNAVPGCESRNIDFMTSRGYALAVESDEELKPLLSGVISGAIDPTAMLRRREEEFPRNAAAAICDLACGAPTE